MWHFSFRLPELFVTIALFAFAPQFAVAKNATSLRCSEEDAVVAQVDGDFCSQMPDFGISPLRKISFEVPWSDSHPKNAAKPIRKIETLVTRGRDDFHKADPKAKFEWSRGDGDEASKFMVDIDPSERHQPIEGFGANLTEAGAVTILKLPPAKQDELLRLFFDKKKGAGFDVMRLPLGATDFSDDKHGNYTYSDKPGEFSIQRDHKSIELLKRAKEINPNLKLIASPWTAPARMKDPESLNGGQLKKEYYQEYAEYIVKALAAVEARGLDLEYFTIQNEPGYEAKHYPTMVFFAKDQVEFIGNHLGPLLEKHKIKTKLLALDHNWDMPEWVETIASSEKVRPYLGGISYHGYAGTVDQMIPIAKKFPDLPLYQTEVSSVSLDKLSKETFAGLSDEFRHIHKWENFFRFYVSSQLTQGLRYGARTALSWNLVLDERNGPRTGGWEGVQPVVNVNDDGGFQRNLDYIALYHASHYLMPGARRIGSPDFSEKKLENVAFQNPDGSIVTLVMNTGDEPLKFTIRAPNCQVLRYELPPNGLATFKWQSNWADEL